MEKEKNRFAPRPMKKMKLNLSFVGTEKRPIAVYTETVYQIKGNPSKKDAEMAINAVLADTDTIKNFRETSGGYTATIRHLVHKTYPGES